MIKLAGSGLNKASKTGLQDPDPDVSVCSPFSQQGSKDDATDAPSMTCEVDSSDAIWSSEINLIFCNVLW